MAMHVQLTRRIANVDQMEELTDNDLKELREDNV